MSETNNNDSYSNDGVIIDFDDEDYNSFVDAESADKQGEPTSREFVQPHTQLVEGFLQIFVGDKQYTFDEKNHINPRLTSDSEVVWDITDKLFSDTYNEWKELATTTISLFARYMKEGGISTRKTPQGFSFDIPINNERKQIVYINEQRSDIEGDPIIQIMTRCGDPKTIPLDRLLHRNMSIPYGAFAITKIEGKDSIVIVDTWLAKSIQDIELRKAVFTIAIVGDEIESKIHHEDRY